MLTTSALATTSIPVKFTGKERDAETGLDYFGARCLSSAQGRWTSPDWSESPQPVPDADFSNPQTLNLYTYGRNNPLSNRDSDGHCSIDGKDYGIWFCVGHAIGASETENERSKRIEGERAFLLANVRNADGSELNSVQQRRLSLSTPLQIDHLYGQLTQEANDRAREEAAALGPLGPMGPMNRPGRLTTNPKHNPNSASPEPRNARELFDKSIDDGTGTRWAKDSDGTIRRFSSPRNGETHWNGSTAGSRPIRVDDIPFTVRRALK